MSKIKTNIYYVNGGAITEQENDANEGFIYIKKGTEGTYDIENELFETDEGEDCSVEAKYVDIVKTGTLY